MPNKPTEPSPEVKQEETVCLHCGKAILKDSLGWIHSESGLFMCGIDYKKANGHLQDAELATPRPSPEVAPMQPEVLPMLPEHIICTFDPKDHHEIDVRKERGFFRNADGSFICDVHELHRRGAEIATLRTQLAAVSAVSLTREPNWAELKETHANDTCANCHRLGSRHFGGGVRPTGLYCQANGMKQFAPAVAPRETHACPSCGEWDHRRRSVCANDWHGKPDAIAPRETQGEFSCKHAADTCRENGWDAGTYLVGDEGYGPELILITAVGQDTILARSLSINGKERRLREGIWDLNCRRWARLENGGR